MWHSEAKLSQLVVYRAVGGERANSFTYVDRYVKNSKWSEASAYTSRKYELPKTELREFVQWLRSISLAQMITTRSYKSKTLPIFIKYYVSNFVLKKQLEECLIERYRDAAWVETIITIWQHKSDDELDEAIYSKLTQLSLLLPYEWKTEKPTEHDNKSIYMLIEKDAKRNVKESLMEALDIADFEPPPAPPPRKIVFFGERNHYDVSKEWQDRVSNARQEYDITLIEGEADAELTDNRLLPETQYEHQSVSHHDASSSPLNDSHAADIPFDVRHLLNIPIDPSLYDILVNVLIDHRMDILPMVSDFIEHKFVRNLKQPSVSFLNMIASLREIIDEMEYDYILQKYSETMAMIDTRTRDIPARLRGIVQAEGELDDARFNSLFDEIMFELPQKLSDLYLTGLIMAQKSKSTLILCGLAHAEYVKQMIDEFYKIDCKIEVQPMGKM